MKNSDEITRNVTLHVFSVALAFENVELISPSVAMTDEGARPSCWTFCAPDSEDPQVSATETPKRSRHGHGKENITPNFGFYREQRPQLSSLWDCGSEEGPDDVFWVDYQTKRHQMEEMKEEECGETDKGDGKKDERKAKKRSVFLISAKWDQVEHHINFGQGLVCRSPPPPSFLI